MKISPVASSGCTTEIRPLRRASARNTNAPTWAPEPNRHNQFLNRWTTSWLPARRSGARDVLSGLVDRVGQGREQGEDDNHRRHAAISATHYLERHRHPNPRPPSRKPHKCNAR